MDDSGGQLLESWELQIQQWIKSNIDLMAPQTIVLLRGPMGSGKTTFAKHLVGLLSASRGLAPEEGFQSPTFSIHNRYLIDDLVVDHFDLYRLKSEDEIASSGFWDLFESRKNWVVVEWPEVANGLWEMSFDNSWIVHKIEFPLFRH